MADQTTAIEPGAKDGLTPEQLATEQAQDLPDREAMSVLSVGGLSGALPLPVDPQAPVTLPDPSLPIATPTGVPSDVDLSNVGGNVGDISDVVDTGDVQTLMDPRDLADLKDVADITGAPVDGGVPVTMLPPVDDPATTLA